MNYFSLDGKQTNSIIKTTTLTRSQFLARGGHRMLIAGFNMFVSAQTSTNLGRWCDETILNKPLKLTASDLFFEAHA